MCRETATQFDTFMAHTFIKIHRFPARRLDSKIVGYQNKEVVDSNAGGFTWCLSTLPSVGVEQSELTLSSWKVTPPEGGLWAAESVMLTTFNTEGQNEGIFYYVDEVNCETFSIQPGWYTAESIDNWDPVSADDTIVPYGAGVQIYSDCGATITFAGEVVSEKSDFEIVDSNLGGFTWTGNVSPVDLTLKDITITPPEGGLWAAESVMLTTFNAEGQNEGIFYYVDEVNCETFSIQPGWYTAESIDNWDPVSAGDVVVKAGEMFQIYSDCGATITIPSAL